MNAVVQSLDSCRVSLLRLTLKPKLFRVLYHRTHTRLALGLFFSTIVALPLAVLRPELLLAFGPMIFGYVHLISSYRFTPPLKLYSLFAVMTVLAIALHLIPLGVTVPFGVWQVLVATLTFLIVQRGRWIVSALALALSACFIKLAWMEPLMFVGGSLILHNWVAFFHWIKVSRTRERRHVAILGTLFFLLIHVCVLQGSLDHWIPRENGSVFFADAAESTAWMLASWSTDAVVWYRFLVLYAFGLSIHYFVWLRAIPESRLTREHPSSFRMMAQELRSFLGTKMLLLTLGVAGAGTLIWLFSRPLGAQIYFEIAILHGWLELLFLLDLSRKPRQPVHH